MRTKDLDFELPPELIAQTPAPHRSESRLLHYQRSDRSIAHRHFAELPSLLRRNDLLIFNDARVIPARFTMQKHTGGRVEGLFLSEPAPGRWEVLLKNLGGPCANVVLRFVDAPQIKARVLEQDEGGIYQIAVDSDEPAVSLLARIGRMPLPPYIKRAKDRDERDELDRERYQTVYAASPGAVAAPTAGLHFTPETLMQLDSAGIERSFVTLNVGLGTFKPVTASELRDHTMHSESYTIPPETAQALNRAKAQQRRIIAVGTTSARVLESQAKDCHFQSTSGETRILIYPPYEWKHVSAMITNFHLPRSTLIAMIAALVGLEEQRRIYQSAIGQRYRFFSYGDAMFLE